MSEPRIDWARAARGLGLAGLGTLLLLNTLGVLPWTFWVEALRYWPVLLIALGLRILFDRSRMPWAVLLSPLLVLLTLAWVATRPEPALPGAWVARRVESREALERWNLQAHLGLAKLRLASRPLAEGLLVDGRSASAEDRGRLEATERDGQAWVDLQGRWKGSMLAWPRDRQVWELDVASRPPLALDLELGFVDAGLNLATADLSRADVRGAFNQLVVSLGAPRQRTPLRLEGAFNDLKLVVPAPVSVRVRTEGPFNLVDRPGGSGDADAAGYDLQIEGAFNKVVVEAAAR